MPQTFIQKIKDNPDFAAIYAVLAPLSTPLTSQLQVYIPGYAALMGLCAIDFFTRILACRKLGIPVTSQVMRDKGIPKLLKYTLVVITAGMTVPIFKSDLFYLAIISFLAFWELHSIFGENMYDAGIIPFDLRETSAFDVIRGTIDRMKGKPHGLQERDRPEADPADGL